MKRGYYGIGIFNSKNSTNLGCLMRTATNFKADFIFTIGKRYRHQCSDTTKTYKHIPLYHYDDYEDFIKHIPHDCKLVAVELDGRSQNLSNYIHRERCVYLLGAEDQGIPQDILQKCNDIIEINSNMCMNVAVAGGIVMYDRQSKKGL